MFPQIRLTVKLWKISNLDTRATHSYILSSLCTIVTSSEYLMSLKSRDIPTVVEI